MPGIWRRSRDLLTERGPMSVREIADALNEDRGDVNQVMQKNARAGRVIRVVSAEPGPLRFRLAGAKEAE